MTTPFETFVAPAREKPAIWRFVVGVVIAALIYVGWAALVIVLSGVVLTPAGGLSWLDAVADSTEPLPTLVLLATFGGMLIGPILAARLMHGRKRASLFGQNGHERRDFWMMALLLYLVAVPSLVLWLFIHDPVMNRPLGGWLIFLPFGILGIALQTLAEEVLFRGYILQSLAARFRSPIVWMILPSIAFGCLHWDPEAGQNAYLIVAATGFFGLVASDLTARSGSLYAAWGLHFANNSLGLLILGLPHSLNGLALFVTPYGVAAPQTVSDLLASFLVLAAMWGLGRLYLRRYG